MSKFYSLLCLINEKQGRPALMAEELLSTNKAALAECIDDLLLDELVSCGLDSNDEPDQYGRSIEAAIDYFNKIRLSL